MGAYPHPHKTSACFAPVHYSTGIRDTPTDSAAWATGQPNSRIRSTNNLRPNGVNFLQLVLTRASF